MRSHYYLLFINLKANLSDHYLFFNNLGNKFIRTHHHERKLIKSLTHVHHDDHNKYHEKHYSYQINQNHHQIRANQ
jgi:hypothetical protein